MIMKFSILQETLFQCLQKVSGVVPSKSTTPVLENVFFELDEKYLRITGTDLEVSVTTQTEPDHIEKSGAVALPARVMIEMIRSLPNILIHFEADKNNKVKMTTDQGYYQISGISKDSFPEIPKYSSESFFEFDNKKLHRMFEKTIFAVSADELRPALMGVFVQILPDEFRMVATDGHRLSKIVDKQFKNKNKPVNMIVPPKAVQLVLKNISSDGTTKMVVDEKMLCFIFNNTTLFTRLVEGQYPDYERVIPTDNTNLLIVNKDLLISTVKRVSLFSNAFTHQVRFSLGKNKMAVLSEDLDLGGEAKEEIKIEYEADPIEIGYNALYVIDILKQVDTESVTFHLKTPMSAAVVTPREQLPKEQFEMLLMPIKLSS
jgi:DNA polymerase-3 subunit beta